MIRNVACWITLIGFCGVIWLIVDFVQTVKTTDPMAAFVDAAIAERKLFDETDGTRRFVSSTRLRARTGGAVWKWPGSDQEIRYSPTAPDGTSIEFGGEGERFIAWSPLLDADRIVVLMSDLEIREVDEAAIDWKCQSLRAGVAKESR